MIGPGELWVSLGNTGLHEQQRRSKFGEPFTDFYHWLPMVEFGFKLKWKYAIADCLHVHQNNLKL